MLRMVANSSEAIEKIEIASQRIADAQRLVRQYATEIGIDLNSRPVPSDPMWAGKRIPAEVIRLAARLKPWQPGEDTVAYAFNTDHPGFGQKRFVSGRNSAGTEGLRPVRGGKGYPVTVTDHVEGHVASEMRRPEGPKAVTLVINNEPCKARPFGCHWLLPDILPAGARLTVYVVGPDGPRYHNTYVGTGRGVTH